MPEEGGNPSGTAAALAPEPPPIPALFSRRAKWLLSAAAAATLILTAGLAVFLTSRAASSAAAFDAQQIEALKSQFSAAADDLNSHAETFRDLVASDLQSQNLPALSAQADSLRVNLYVFDDTVMHMRFPRSMVRDLAHMLSADETLSTDLESPPDSAASSYAVRGWVLLLRSDYASDGAAHAALGADLGLSSNGLPGAGAKTT